MFTVIFDFYLRELGSVSIPQDIYSFKVNLVFWVKIRTVICSCLLLSWKCVVNVDCPSHRWPKLTTGARTWLVLAVLCYNGYLQRLVWDVNGFKIDLPYCLFAFFVVCRRLRPFGSGVFGELALFWCSVYIPYKPMSSVMGSCLCK